MNRRPQAIPEIPGNVDTGLRRALIEMRKAINRLESSAVPPAAPSNLKATAKAGGVILQWTKSDGTGYVVYRNSSANLDGAIRFDAGNSASYIDEIGKEGVTLYYWIRAKKNSMESAVTGPVNATTLALTAEITFPTPPAPSQQPIISDETDYIIP